MGNALRERILAHKLTSRNTHIGPFADEARRDEAEYMSYVKSRQRASKRASIQRIREVYKRIRKRSGNAFNRVFVSLDADRGDSGFNLHACIADSALTPLQMLIDKEEGHGASDDMAPNIYNRPRK